MEESEKTDIVSIDKKLDILLDEKSEVNSIKLEMQKFLTKLVIIFLTLFATTAGIIINEEIIKDPDLQQSVMFILSQVELFIAALALVIGCKILVCSSHMRAMENKINELCGVTINIWESEIVHNYIYGIKGFFFWISIILIVIISGLYFIIYYYMIPISMKSILIPIIIIGFFMIAALLLLLFKETKRIYNHSTDKLSWNNNK